MNDLFMMYVNASCTVIHSVMSLTCGVTYLDFCQVFYVVIAWPTSYVNECVNESVILTFMFVNAICVVFAISGHWSYVQYWYTVHCGIT